MNKVSTVIKNEFYRYFISPLAYVYLIGFLLLNGSFTFYFGHFFERGQADLLSMFAFQPWLYLLFVPGISMRLWAEEFRSKTILQTATLPVSLSTFVWGKFLASWLFCALALVLTFPFWAVVNYLGSPDNAVIAAGYLGSLLLAGCMLAISQTMSALTKNQVIALVLAVIANLFFFLSGLEYVLGLFRDFFSPAIVDMIASFSFLTHFDTVSRGLFELRDIIFFASLILLFNFTTVLIVSFRTKGTSAWLSSTRRGSYILVFAFLLIGFCGLNLLANNYLRNFQIDFTEEGIFTLTSSTRKVIAEIKSPITAKLYYSPILGRRNAAVRLMFDKVRLLLNQYASLSNGKIELKIYNPLPLSNTEDRAIAGGLQPLPIIDSNINAYFGLILSDEEDNKEVIPFFPLERQNFIEQDLTEAFYRLGRKKPKLGLLTSLPMGDEMIGNVVTPRWEVLNQLSRFYDVVAISNTQDNLDNIDILMIAHPQDLSEELIGKIKEYSLKGGKVLAFFDIAPEALPLVGPLQKPLSASDYGDLSQAWGIRFYDEAVVADLDNSSLIDATTNYQNNPEFTQDLIQFYLKDSSFNTADPTTKGLKKMLLTSASVFAPRTNAAISFEPLLQASQNSALMSANVVYKHIHPAVILRAFEKDNNPKYIAARIRGKNTPLDIIVVGDSDLLYDNFWTTHQTILENNYAIPVLDNINFVLNALDALREDDTLINLRGKSYKSRPFNEIEQARIYAAKDFKVKEKEIFDNLARAKAGMQEIIGKRIFENRETFTPDELAIIAGIRKQIDKERRNLFEIRLNFNDQTTKLKNTLKFATVYTIPLILLLFLIWPFFSKKTHSDKPHVNKLNRQIFIIGSTSLLLLGAGLFSVWYTTRNTSLNYEDKPLFENLAAQINNISTIELKSHDKGLIFTQDADNGWQLQGYSSYLVYQNRIRSFLSALLEATYYEKKAGGLEKLAKFDLSPIEDEKSKAVEVTLKDAKGTNILQFYVGKYDLDLGRGSRGAYIRFTDSFQVWLAQMDLIDLSLNADDWTFSTLWNLQFGRIAEINGDSDPDTIADIAKELLNIHFIKAIKTLPSTEPQYTLDIKAEHDANVIISFYPLEKNWLVRYEFIKKSTSELLQNFAACVKDIAYEISATDMEKLINASPSFRSKD